MAYILNNDEREMKLVDAVGTTPVYSSVIMI